MVQLASSYGLKKGISWFAWVFLKYARVAVTSPRQIYCFT